MSVSSLPDQAERQAGAISCTFRQTNIVWVLYAYAASQIAYLRYRRNGVRLHDPLARQATFGK